MISTTISWLGTDLRLNTNELSTEWRNCRNGHLCFISNCRGFVKGIPETIKCSVCGTDIFKFSPFLVTYEELSVNEDGKFINSNGEIINEK